jgi:hypothetical protein
LASSGGHFGFSVQKRIWKSTIATNPDVDDSGQRFGKITGQFVDGILIENNRRFRLVTKIQVCQKLLVDTAGVS